MFKVENAIDVVCVHVYLTDFTENCCISFSISNTIQFSFLLEVTCATLLVNYWLYGLLGKGEKDS